MVHEVVSVIDSVPVTKQRPPPPGDCHACAWHVQVSRVRRLRDHGHALSVSASKQTEILTVGKMFAVEVLEDKLGDAGQPRANRAVTVDKPQGNPNRCANAAALTVT